MRFSKSKFSALVSVSLLHLAIMCLLGTVNGCAKDQATLDHRAAVMNGIANTFNASTPDQIRDNAPLIAWNIENERRAAQNLSDTWHWTSPTYKWPASQPTTLPWTPVDDTSGTASQ